MPPDDESPGFVLITVIWLAGLLALVAASFAGSVRHQTEAAASALAIARAEATAAGALRYVAYRLLTAPAAVRQPGMWSGAPLRCRLPSGETALVTLQDQAGLVDLNLAELPLIEALLAAVGLESAPAARLAEAIVDYRDRDETNAAGHPEAEAYAALGWQGALKNGPFDTIYELDRVPGMHPLTLDRLLPWVTVHSPHGKIDRAAAPRALVTALSRSAPRLLGDEQHAGPSPRTRVAVEIALPARPGQALRAIVSLEGPSPRFLLIEPVRRPPPVAAAPALC